jgi:hypothetical protein
VDDARLEGTAAQGFAASSIDPNEPFSTIELASREQRGWERDKAG